MTSRTRRFRGAVAATGVALVAALTLTACGDDASANESGSSTLTIKHAQGETQVPTDPQKVAVLDFAVLDTLDTLGVPVAGVPKQALPPMLSKYADGKYADYGTNKTADAEAVAASAPDLIIVAGRSAASYAEMSKIAPTVDLTSDGDALEALKSTTTTVGQIFGKQDQASAALKKIDDQVAAAKKATAGKGDGLIVLVTGGKMSAFGAGSRFGLLHDALGVTPAAPELKVDIHGQSVSFEYIAETNPDWLFVIDRDAAIGQQSKAAMEVLDNPLVAKTTAWQKKQVVTLDGYRWYSLGSGLSNVSEMIKSVQDTFAK
ncbi:siderophore ABC transporter substrate-binding protein [Rhodococcus sp. X156]|uniref:siderophore ABC transporter substrate-binding protein n=1 Tax=Rhodococcus sp. X156 TaxID=2499145 RepID=UPI000FD6D0F7|nr:siderophore ABC transporter substrate-binding protein [Rhodococcus sp. X156]